MYLACIRPTDPWRAAAAALVACAPIPALAQSSPFLTGATALGLVPRLDGRDSDRLRRAADRHVGPRHFRRLGAMSPTPSARNGGLTADPLFIGATRPPMRWGVTYSALLANLVLTMEAF